MLLSDLVLLELQAGVQLEVESHPGCDGCWLEAGSFASELLNFKFMALHSSESASGSQWQKLLRDEPQPACHRRCLGKHCFQRSRKTPDSSVQVTVLHTRAIHTVTI